MKAGAPRETNCFHFTVKMQNVCLAVLGGVVKILLGIEEVSFTKAILSFLVSKSLLKDWKTAPTQLDG